MLTIASTTPAEPTVEAGFLRRYIDGKIACRDRMQGHHSIYENAPLVEVIAEVRWSLVALRAIPGSQIDPHFTVFAEEFSRLAKDEGLGCHERPLPQDTPLELVGGNPVMRFRSRPGAWPLFQIGPGLLTANIVPPYEGWKAFRAFLKKGIDHLFHAYPLVDRYLRLNRIELRYIDGFTDRHSSYNDFLSKRLRINVNIPPSLLEGYAISDNDYFTNIETVMNLKIPECSTGILKFNRGTKEGADALIGQLVVRREEDVAELDKCSLLKWFDEARATLHEWFELLADDELKKRMGPKRVVKEKYSGGRLVAVIGKKVA